MRAIIVDDELPGIETLEKMLQELCPEVTIVATCRSAAEAADAMTHGRPDLLFLDIQMPGKTGLELLAELTQENMEVIFVTAHNEFLLQALQYSAADFLLKPVDEDRLVEAVSRAKSRLEKGRKESSTATLIHNLQQAGKMAEMRLCLPTTKGFSVLRLDEIIYCEAERSYTIFHLDGDRKLMVSKPLYDYEMLLGDTIFLRIHKSFLINLHHIKEYQRGEGGIVLMSDGAQIEVSRRKKDLFLLKVKEIFKY